MNTVFILHLNIYNLYQISEFAFHFTFGKSFISSEKQYDLENQNWKYFVGMFKVIHLSFHLEIALQNRFKSDTEHILLHVLAFLFTHQSNRQAT